MASFVDCVDASQSVVVGRFRSVEVGHEEGENREAQEPIDCVQRGHQSCHFESEDECQDRIDGNTLPECEELRME